MDSQPPRPVGVSKSPTTSMTVPSHYRATHWANRIEGGGPCSPLWAFLEMPVSENLGGGQICQILYAEYLLLIPSQSFSVHPASSSPRPLPSSPLRPAASGSLFKESRKGGTSHESLHRNAAPKQFSPHLRVHREPQTYLLSILFHLDGGQGLTSTPQYSPTQRAVTGPRSPQGPRRDTGLPRFGPQPSNTPRTSSYTSQRRRRPRVRAHCGSPPELTPSQPPPRCRPCALRDPRPG